MRKRKKVDMTKGKRVLALSRIALAAGAFGAMLFRPVPEAQATPGSGASRTVYDDFSSGFSVNTPTAKWFYFSAGPFVGNGGTESTSRRGLHVEANGRNPRTGQPAFTNTVAPDSISGIPGGVDHVKWLAYATHPASSGIAGWDAIPGKELACEWRMSGRTFGNRFHPFGRNVQDANDDLRLSAYAANAIDLETLMVFDWFITNETIYAFYERLPFARAALGNYAAFSFNIPVAKTNPGQAHHFKTAYDKTGNRVRWILDGKEVFSVNRLGFLINRKYMTLDHGGTEEVVSPRQLDCGMGMFTLLDAHLPSKVGLVKVSDTPSFYFNPEVGAPTPETFVDGTSLLSNRLFGQGAEFDVRNLTVSYRNVNDRHRDDEDDDDDNCHP